MQHNLLKVYSEFTSSPNWIFFLDFACPIFPSVHASEKEEILCDIINYYQK